MKLNEYLYHYENHLYMPKTQRIYINLKIKTHDFLTFSVIFVPIIV